MPMIPEKLTERMEASGIIAVLIIDDAENAVPLAKTLVESGITAMELTLRTDAALTALQLIRREVPEMLAGIGTILQTGQVATAKESGADFGVSPGYNPRIVEEALRRKLPFAPGIATPSDIEGALEQDCRVLKFFHAEGMGGPRYLRGMNAPYSFLGLKYIPLGGLKPENAASYLEMPEVLAIGGSWIAPRDLVQAKDWKAVGELASKAAALFKNIRG